MEIASLSGKYDGRMTEKITNSRQAIQFMIVATLLNSAAQLLYKESVNAAGLDIVSLLMQGTIFLGLLAYAASGLVMILSLRGGEASRLYPIYTLSFVWIALGSWFFFGEHISSTSLAGMAAVVAGIILINSRSTKKKRRVGKVSST